LLAVGCIVALAAQAAAQPRAPDRARKDYSNDPLVARMMAFDKNKDGQLTRDEITDERLLRLFDRADTNKDGVVTREELIALAAKMDAEFGQQEGRGRRGGPGGFGGPPGGGRGGPFQPGQVMPNALQVLLMLSDDQKKQVEELQKEVDAKLAKILTEEQNKQLKEMQEGRRGGARGPAGGGAGGRGPAGRGGLGGPGGPPQPGQILPAFLQERLYLTDEQKKQVEELQKEVDRKLDKILTEEQKRRFQAMRQGFGPGGRGGRGGLGGPGGGAAGGLGGPPRPGQILPPFMQEQLNLTAEQKKQLEELQKEVEARLAKILTEEQRKQLEQMQGGFRGRGPGRGGRGGPPEP
jgi:Spy/CpxP family protein refolding chaperone